MNSHTMLILGWIVVAIPLGGCSTSSNSETSYIEDFRDFSLNEHQGNVQPAAKLPDISERASLYDLLSYAALNNSALEAAFNRWKASLERIPQVKALPDPRFTYRYFIEEVETRIGGQRQSFGISQKFPWFGKLELRADAASEAARAERQRFESLKLKLFYQVKAAYWEYYYLERMIAVTDENVKLLIHIEAVTRTRYKVAAASHPDVIRAQVALGKLHDRLRSVQDLRGPIVARINALLNRPTEAPLALPDKPKQEEISISDEKLLELLERDNTELKAMDFETARRKVTIDLAKKDYFPDVTVGVDYIDTSNSTAGRHPSDDGKDPLIAGVSINLPIWWDKLSAGVREARRRYRVAVLSRRQRANSLGAELKMVAYRFRDAERRMALYRDTLLPKARESLKATEASFRAGRGSFIDLIDTQRIFLEFELSYERAVADRAQRLAELEMFIARRVRPVGVVSDG